VDIRLEASSILNIVDVQKYYSLAAILLASCIRRWREHHEGVHPPLHDSITLPIKYPSQKAANIDDCSPHKQPHPCPHRRRCHRRLEVVYISYKHLKETDACLNMSVISSISTPKDHFFSFHLSPNDVVPLCFVPIVLLIGCGKCFLLNLVSTLTKEVIRKGLILGP
jgi:hypothetical protein